MNTFLEARGGERGIERGEGRERETERDSFIFPSLQ